MGYLNRPKETADTYKPGGYLRTGDLGAIDDDGFISVTDRIKEMIKVNTICTSSRILFTETLAGTRPWCSSG